MIYYGNRDHYADLAAGQKTRYLTWKIHGVETYYMINVLCVGNYDKRGVFVDDRWSILLKWLSDNCNNIRIYTELNITQISNRFSKYSDITEEVSPDPDLNYKCFRLRCKDKKLWDVIAGSWFDIDTGITHIYFLNEEDYKAEFEVEDCENFVFLHVTNEDECNLVKMMPSILKNIEECTFWKEQITYLLDGELWKPLGKWGKRTVLLPNLDWA